MAANDPMRENELVDAAVTWLRERIPAAWSVEPADQDAMPGGRGRPGGTIVINGQSVFATLAVEAKRSLRPRDVAGLFGSVGRTLRALSPDIPILVVAPWLSPRTRDLLAAEGINFLDLTGNALVRLESPALFIQSQGADRDPSPTPRGKARVRGPKAARLIRTLIDVRPPYGVRDLAEATGLAPGYISRLLYALDDDALLERSKRGQVESVDIAALLRRWAESYELFRSNDAQPYLAARGAEDALGRLPELPTLRTAVSGSFAAVRLSPVAAPALLTVYCEDAKALADALDLIPADRGANVVLLRPFDPIVWERTDEEGGVRYVAPSQAAVDCLTGNGRMPAEGEALIQWLLANEPAWRLDSLARVGGPPA
ncbi:MAG TPA: type IV toxin-antitoxin system AbiEi family antitoxin [Solirubrobacteraceae bacterium]|nr:type IV toxin-antitoxin system AbiEi family antitoxin [Solirubrobacteraceae bacterium]